MGKHTRWPACPRVRFICLSNIPFSACRAYRCIVPLVTYPINNAPFVIRRALPSWLFPNQACGRWKISQGEKSLSFPSGRGGNQNNRIVKSKHDDFPQYFAIDSQFSLTNRDSRSTIGTTKLASNSTEGGRIYFALRNKTSRRSCPPCGRGKRTGTSKYSCEKLARLTWGRSLFIPGIVRTGSVQVL